MVIQEVTSQSGVTAFMFFPGQMCHSDVMTVLLILGYLAPRNLPSTGFFPFLQTLLCDTDSKCKDTPYGPQDLLRRKGIDDALFKDRWGHFSSVFNCSERSNLVSF